jgi:hypothetical protein
MYYRSFFLRKEPSPITLIPTLQISYSKCIDLPYNSFLWTNSRVNIKCVYYMSCCNFLFFYKNLRIYRKLNTALPTFFYLELLGIKKSLFFIGYLTDYVRRNVSLSFAIVTLYIIMLFGILSPLQPHSSNY